MLTIQSFPPNKSVGSKIPLYHWASPWQLHEVWKLVCTKWENIQCLVSLVSFSLYPPFLNIPHPHFSSLLLFPFFPPSLLGLLLALCLTGKSAAAFNNLDPFIERENWKNWLNRQRILRMQSRVSGFAFRSSSRKE